MARFGVDGLAQLTLTMGELAGTPDGVLDAMLDAGADVLVGAIRSTASTMLDGPYSEGAVAASVKKGKKSKTKDGRQIRIGFAGKQHGESLARIAYINEYGKSTQHARPFIRAAVKGSAEEVVEAEQRVYDEYLKSKKL